MTIRAEHSQKAFDRFLKMKRAATRDRPASQRLALGVQKGMRVLKKSVWEQIYLQ
jgi:hypothetical protein